jgi:hypothetical protein
VIGGPPAAEDPDLCARLASHPALEDWPLIVVTDDARRAAASTMNFLWTTFTRFEPAADLYAARTEVVRHHLVHHNPILLDARVKPGFPEELFCDRGTARRVEQRWGEYFPGGVEMGDSDRGHLD